MSEQVKGRYRAGQVFPPWEGYLPWIALAAAAGAAIANARRFAESEQRRRWLDASAELTPLLLADNQGTAARPDHRARRGRRGRGLRRPGRAR